jgi:hypothetical protein
MAEAPMSATLSSREERTASEPVASAAPSFRAASSAAKARLAAAARSRRRAVPAAPQSSTGLVTTGDLLTLRGHEGA